MQLPGSAAIPAPYRERGQIAYETGKRIVEMVHEDLKPSDIMTRQAFENAIVVNSAIGGSTNAPIHLNAIARHLGVPLDNDDWQKLGHQIPLLVNLQPAGEYLGEDYHHAGGVPAVVAELMKAGLLPNPDALTVNGKSIGDNCKGVENLDTEGDPPGRRSAQAACRLHQPQGQSVRQRHHEDQRDLAGVPRPLSVEPERSGGLRGQGDGVRRAGGLPRPHRRSGARHRRAHDPVHARRRPGRLSRRAPRWSTCSRRPTSSRRASTRCPASATAASRARRARRRSSMPRPKPPSAAGWRCSGPATACASISGKGTANILISDEELARAARRAQRQWRLPLSQAPDAVAGNPARHGRPAGARHGAEAGGQIPRRRPHQRRAARQSLRQRARPIRHLRSPVW